MPVGHSSFRLQSKWFFAAIAALIVIFAAEMFFSARRESQTFDEPAHLYAGYSYWLHGDFGINPEHPPLVKLVASLPLLIERPSYPKPLNVFFRGASVLGGRQLFSTPDAQSLLAHSRIAVSVFVFLLALFVVLAAKEMFGKWTALFALTLFVFSPMMIANGPLVGTDVGATCFIFGTVYTFYRYVKQPSLIRLAVCAVVAGLTLASKHSGLVVLPFLILLSAVEIALYRPPQGENSLRARARYALRLAGAFAAIVVVSVTILWAFYGFRYAARPNGEQIVPPPAVYLKQLHRPVEGHIIAFAEHHHLLPQAYLFGLTDVTIISNTGRPMYLFGKLYSNGRWFYFPSAFVIKMTLGFLLLFLLMPFARVIWGSEKRREVLFLLVPALAYSAVAMMSKLNIGFRHFIPVIPFLMVLVAAAAVSHARQSRALAWAVSVLLAFVAVSSLSAYPNYLPYSNQLFGGPSQTYRSLSDSNVGWGGGLKALHAYIERNHITHCWFAYSAVPNPSDFQIPCKELPTYFGMLKDNGQQQAVPADLQGPIFISSEELAGSFWGTISMNPYLQFTTMHPSHVIAGEILEFNGNFQASRVASASHFVMARTLLNKHNLNDALTNAQQAVALNPNFLYAHELLSHIYAANHQPDKAMNQYQAAEQLFAHVDPAFVKDRVVSPPQRPVMPKQSQLKPEAGVSAPAKPSEHS